MMETWNARRESQPNGIRQVQGKERVSGGAGNLCCYLFPRSMVAQNGVAAGQWRLRYRSRWRPTHAEANR